MSAEILRKAASLMRERAEAARAGRWSIAASSLTPDGYLVVADWEHGPKRVATCSGSLNEGNLLNAEHIASWHPDVALAVADWLEVVAERNEALLSTFAESSRAGAVTAAENTLGWHEALVAARAYLGGAA